MCVVCVHNLDHWRNSILFSCHASCFFFFFFFLLVFVDLMLHIKVCITPKAHIVCHNNNQTTKRFFLTLRLLLVCWLWLSHWHVQTRKKEALGKFSRCFRNCIVRFVHVCSSPLAFFLFGGKTSCHDYSKHTEDIEICHSEMKRKSQFSVEYQFCWMPSTTTTFAHVFFLLVF